MKQDEDNEERPTRPDETSRPGGGAAERLREFLAERFGDEAPPVPPDEDSESEEKEEESEGEETESPDSDAPDAEEPSGE